MDVDHLDDASDIVQRRFAHNGFNGWRNVYFFNKYSFHVIKNVAGYVLQVACDEAHLQLETCDLQPS